MVAEIASCFFAKQLLDQACILCNMYGVLEAHSSHSA